MSQRDKEMRTFERDLGKLRRVQSPARVKEVKVKDKPKKAKAEDSTMKDLNNSFDEIKIQLTNIQDPQRNAPATRFNIWCHNSKHQVHIAMECPRISMSMLTKKMYIQKGEIKNGGVQGGGS